jgi:hypothetical protein
MERHTHPPVRTDHRFSEEIAMPQFSSTLFVWYSFGMGTVYTKASAFASKIPRLAILRRCAIIERKRNQAHRRQR